MGKRKAAANRHLCADDAVTAEEILLAAEHVHRAALAARIATLAAGQFRHHPVGIHAASQHMAVVAIGGHDRVALFADRMQADNYSFLTDIEMAETADLAHAIELAGLFLKPPDQQHIAIHGDQIVLRRQVVGRRCATGCLWRPSGLALACCFYRFGHLAPPVRKAILSAHRLRGMLFCEGFTENRKFSINLFICFYSINLK